MSSRGQSFVDLFLAAIARRRGVRVALAVLAVLYAAAIYAPLLANDRPYWLDAIDVAGYAAARRSIVSRAVSLQRIATTAPETWLAERLAGSTMSWQEAVAAESAGSEQSLATLARHAPEEQRGAIEDCARLVGELEQAVREHELGDVASKAENAVASSRALQLALPDVDPRRPDEARARLRSAHSSPLCAALTASEVFFMILWAFVLAAPLRAHDPPRRRREPPPRRARIALALGCSLVLALAWKAAVGGERTFATAPYRQAIARGDLIAERAWFPPIALGFAETSLHDAYAPPSWAGDPSEGGGSSASARHWLGTDSLGRDLLARMLWGGRVSLSIGLLSALLLCALGTAAGAVAGYFGGWIDLAVSRTIEVVLCFPSFLLILLVAASSDPNVLPPIFAIAIVIALVGWTGVARLARGEFLRLRDQEFVVAARALGFSSARTIVRHVLPNALGPVLVAGSFAVAAGVLIESSLSYLGFGIAAPIPSWGALINESRNPEHWWIHVFPGFSIFATVLCYNLVGEGIRDALDPRTRARAR